jgi:hypothetical protein
LGYASVRLMLSEMTSKEITEWAAYFQIKDDRLRAERMAAEAEARAKRNNR